MKNSARSGERSQPGIYSKRSVEELLMKMRSRMSKHNNQKGFTLVELMVVVVIIGILVAIAVPVYNSVTEKAATNACKANQRTILGAIEAYTADHDGTAPTDMDDLTDAADPYLKSAPKHPTSGTAYGLSGCPDNDADHAL